MDTRVIAPARNDAILDRLASTLDSNFPPGRLVAVPITSDVDHQIGAIEAGAGDIPVDAHLVNSAASAFTSEGHSPHFKACIMSIRHSGLVSLLDHTA